MFFLSLQSSLAVNVRHCFASEDIRSNEETFGDVYQTGINILTRLSTLMLAQ